MKHKQNSLFFTFVSLAWPTVLEELMVTVVQYIDTAMVGQAGAGASAAVGLSTTLNWLINSPMQAMGIGFLAYIAKAIGEGSQEKARRAAGQAAMVAAILGTAEGILALAASPFMPVWMGAEPSIHREGSIYFALICAPMLFRAATAVLGMVIRAFGDTRTPMKINIAVNLLNIVLNYLLIYDTRSIAVGGYSLTVWGAGLGAAGAGAATCISFIVGGIWMSAVYFGSRGLGVSRRELQPDGPILRDCIKIGLPVAMTRVVTCIGYVIFASLVAGLGTVVFAAHSIAHTAESLFYIPGYGMQTATSVLVGNAYGERNKEKFKRVTGIAVGLIVLIMCISGLTLFAGAGDLMGLFTPDPEVAALGAGVLRIVAVSEPLFGVSVVLEGVLSGVGKPRYTFIIETVTMWGIRIVGTLICIRVFGLGLTAVWLCMVISNACKAVLFSLMMLLPGLRERVWR